MKREILRTADWIGLAGGAIGLLAIGAVALHAAADRSLVESGALFIAFGVARALTVAGVGFALGSSRLREGALSCVLLVVGLVVGFAGKERLLSAIVTGPGTAFRLFLIDPAACLAVGAMLAPPGGIRRWLFPAGAPCVGVLISFSIGLNNPGPDKPDYLIGGAIVAVWLVLVTGLLVRGIRLRWPRVPAVTVRIVGAWLIAIGLLLGGAAFARRAEMASAAPPLPPAQIPWIPEKAQPPSRQKLPGLAPLAPP